MIINRSTGIYAGEYWCIIFLTRTLDVKVCLSAPDRKIRKTNDDLIHDLIFWLKRGGLKSWQLLMLILWSLDNGSVAVCLSVHLVPLACTQVLLSSAECLFSTTPPATTSLTAILQSDRVRTSFTGIFKICIGKYQIGANPVIIL